MNKRILLCLGICTDTFLMLNASHVFRACYYFNAWNKKSFLRAYSSSEAKNNMVQNPRHVSFNEEPHVKEDSAFPLKNLSLLKHIPSENTKKTLLEKALTEQPNFAFDSELQKELNRINAEHKKS